MEAPWLTALLQTADALFPTGAYAHSLGLEESIRLGVVHDGVSLRAFLSKQLVPALREQELPYLRFAYQSAEAGDLAALCSLDREIGAWKLPFETRQASAQIGVRRLRSLLVINDAALLHAFAARVEDGFATGHHLIICALQAVAECIPLEAALAAYFYQTLASACTAALKLMRIGQDACQRVLRSALRDAQDAVERSLSVAREDAGWFNPLLEIASMRHERAEERMFIS